jgi:hypothetical protein
VSQGTLRTVADDCATLASRRRATTLPWAGVSPAGTRQLFDTPIEETLDPSLTAMSVGRTPSAFSVAISAARAVLSVSGLGISPRLSA